MRSVADVQAVLDGIQSKISTTSTVIATLDGVRILSHRSPGKPELVPLDGEKFLSNIVRRIMFFGQGKSFTCRQCGHSSSIAAEDQCLQIPLPQPQSDFALGSLVNACDRKVLILCRTKIEIESVYMALQQAMVRQELANQAGGERRSIGCVHGGMKGRRAQRKPCKFLCPKIRNPDLADGCLCCCEPWLGDDPEHQHRRQAHRALGCQKERHAIVVQVDLGK